MNGATAVLATSGWQAHRLTAQSCLLGLEEAEPQCHVDRPCDDVDAHLTKPSPLAHDGAYGHAHLEDAVAAEEICKPERGLGLGLGLELGLEPASRRGV